MTDYLFEQSTETGLLQGPLADLSAYQGNYGYVSEYDSLEAMLDKFVHDGRPVAFDIETGYTGMPHEKRSLDVHNLDQMIVGISFANDTQMARYVPLKHDDTPLNLDPNKVWPRIKEFFESGAVDLIAHNAQFELRNLATLDLKGDGPDIFPQRIQDTILQSYVIGQSQQHGLKYLSKHWFNYDQRELADLVMGYAPKKKDGTPKFTTKDKNCLRFNPLPLDHDVMHYVCDDVTWCWRLDSIFRPNLDIFGPKLDRLYRTEIDIMQLLSEMSSFGISVDWDGISEGLGHYHVVIANMEKEARRELSLLIDDEYAVAFNFGSPQQVSNLLFTKLGLTPTAFTDTNKPSTSEDTLEGLRKKHPIIDMILKLRQAKKMGQWFEQWVGYRTTHDDKVHPSLNQIRVQSGRFASDNPNVQNITKKWWYSSVQRNWEEFPPGADEAFEKYAESIGEPNKTVWTGNARDYLIASPGYRLLSFDYAQQELRVLAALAQEPYLIKAFAEGVDIHSATAALMFNKPIEECGKDSIYRQRGKTINFALIYGQGPKALGDQLGIPVEEAKNLMATYFAAFTNVSQWITQAKISGHRDGFVTSFYGRRSTLWDLLSDNEKVRSKAERMCVNLPVQGGGADISKLAMLRARKALVDQGWWGDEVKLLMNQHDSLVFEVRDDLPLQQVIDLLTPQVMLEGVPEVDGFPPLEVDWEWGHKWGSVKSPDKSPFPESEVSKVSAVPKTSPKTKITKNITPEGIMKISFSCAEFSVELSEEDGRRQFPNWDDLDTVSRFAKLSAFTELLGSHYQASHQIIAQDEFDAVKARVAPIIFPKPKAA